MSWFDDLEAKLEQYGKYIDPNGKIRDLIDTGGSPIEVAKLMGEGFQEDGISGALGNFTESAGALKKIISDIPVHEMSNLLVGNQGPIRPSQDVAAEALFPDRDISGETPNILPATGNPSISQYPIDPIHQEESVPVNLDPAVEKQNQEIDDIIGHIGRGAVKTGVGAITDPLLPLLGAAGPVGAMAGAAFVPEMAKSGGEELGTSIALGKDQGDIGGAIEHGISGVTNLVMAGAGGLHTGKRISEGVSPLVPDILNKKVVWEAPKESRPATPPPKAGTGSVVDRKLTPEEISKIDNDPLFRDDAMEPVIQGILKDRFGDADPIEARALQGQLAGLNVKAPSELRNLAAAENIRDIGKTAVEENAPLNEYQLKPDSLDVEPTKAESQYLEIKPIIDAINEASPIKYDPTRIGMGLGGFKGKGPKDPYEGPYSDIEKEIEGIEGISEPNIEIPEAPAPAPKRNLPVVPKGNVDIRAAIKQRAEEIKAQVVGIDPVKASQLAMLDIVREQSTKGTVPPEVPISKVEGTSPEIRDLIEEKAPTPKEPRVKAEVEEILPTKRYSVTMEDGSTHILKGTDEAKVKAFAEKNWGKIAESKELAKGERVGGRKPPKPPKETTIPKEEPFKSEEKPSKSSLADDLTDLPKTLKSSFDISFPLRQGLFLLNRATGSKAILRGTKSGFSEKSHLDVQKDLAERPNATLYKQFGLNQIRYDPTEANSLSEQHPLFKTNPSKFSSAVQEIPGLKQSERMFTDSGNLTRADIFDSLHKKWSSEGKTPETRPDLYYGISKYLNVLTGRDPLPKKLQQASHILNKLFWSPQYVKSRLQILNPVFYAKLPREVQRMAIRDVGGTLGTLTILLSAVNYAAKLSGQEDEIHTEWNPTHSDFGKLRVGKTKYDFFTGLVPIIRTASRIATSRKETPKGEYQLKGGFGLGSRFFDNPTEDLPATPFGQSGFSELGQFAEGKTAPAYQIGKGLLSGKDYYGNEYGVPEFFSDAVAPMGASDIISAWKNYDAKEGMKALPSLLGVGVQADKVKDTENSSWRKKKKSKKKSLLLY